MASMLSQREQGEVDWANETGRKPVVFVHGLWLLPASWNRWRGVFEENGYTTLAPDWPDNLDTAGEPHQHLEVFAHKGVQKIHDHCADVIRSLKTAPSIIGHSFGGLIAQQLAGDGLASVSVAIDAAPFRGVPPLPFSPLKTAFSIVENAGDGQLSVGLSFEQFRFAFANAVGESEAEALYQAFSVPGVCRPLFQAATTNIDPWTEARVDSMTPKRGPLLIISGERDNTVPSAISNAAYKLQKRNVAITEIREIPNRGHSLTIDSGWREVAEIALAFVKRHDLATR